MKLYAELTPDQVAAVRAYARKHGRNWKQELRYAWMAASEPGLLHALRNSHGPQWLIRYKLPALPPSTGEVEVLSRVEDGRTLRLMRDGRNWRMTGGPAGDHTLFDSSEERAMAHWKGYAVSNRWRGYGR